jgi:class 3 adenylate cyclase
MSYPHPQIQYTSVGDADVAYMVLGDGPIELLYSWGLGGHIDLVWDQRVAQELFPRLASFSRLIMFDRRGTGASDPVPSGALPTWESWTEDIRAVLDAAESTKAVLFASTDCGATAILFTAMHPDRVSSLVLHNTTARYMEADDYPIGASPEAIEAMRGFVETHWGTETFATFAVPDAADDPEALRLAARQMRAGSTPRAAAAQIDYIARSMDVRETLRLVQVPTLILQSDNPFFPIAHGRYLAEHISDATLVELPGPGIGQSTVEEIGAVADEIALFLTGERQAVEVNRILTTVMFTDIANSTERVSRVGDRVWRSMLDAHDNAVREQLRRFKGREVNTTGDGFMASFDGPGRAIRCARAIIEATANLGIVLRAGLHTGECEVRGDDLGGLAVHIAARVGALAAAGEVLISGTVKDLVVGSGIEFADRGERELKGVPGSWKLFAVTD